MAAHDRQSAGLRHAAASSPLNHLSSLAEGGGSPSAGTLRSRRRPPTASGADGASSLETVAVVVQLLTTGPHPLGIDGGVIGHGLPRRFLPLPELGAVTR